LEPPDSDAGLAATIDLGRSFEDSLAVAFELAPVPLLLVDRVGIVRRANEMAAQQTDGGDLIGRSLADAGFDPAGIEYLPSQARSSEFARMSEAAESPAHLQLVRLTDPTAESVVPDSVGNLVHQIADSLPDISTILYDSDLRVVAAGGRPFHRAGFDAKAMAGRSLAEILGESFDDLAPRLRDALTGRESTMDFLSPRNGLEYDVTCRPIRGLGGRVIAGLMTNREVTEDLRGRTQLDEIQRLSQVGSATFDRIHGWTIDADLLRLFGVDAMEEIPTAWETLVLEEDRRAVQAAYDSVLRSGGRVSVRYRLRQPATGEIRDAQGGFMAAVDANGRLVRAVITHVDITAAVAGERLRAKAATDRTQLLRRVSDILAQGTDDRVASIQRIADLASATIGGETLVRVVTLKDGVPDLNLLSDPGTDVAAEVAVRGSIRAWTPPPSRLDPDEPLAHLYSSIGNPAWRDEYRHQTGHLPWWRTSSPPPSGTTAGCSASSGPSGSMTISRSKPVTTICCR
jgi:PAS domain-containing protein